MIAPKLMVSNMEIALAEPERLNRQSTREAQDD